MWRPKENWIIERNVFFETHQPIKPYYKTRQIDYEAGADGMLKEIIKNRPSEEEIRFRIIDTLWGRMDVPELFEWLKDKLLAKP